MFDEPIGGFNEKQKLVIDKFYDMIYKYDQTYDEEDIMQDSNTNKLYQRTKQILNKIN